MGLFDTTATTRLGALAGVLAIAGLACSHTIDYDPPRTDRRASTFPYRLGIAPFRMHAETKAADTVRGRALECNEGTGYSGGAEAIPSQIAHQLARHIATTGLVEDVVVTDDTSGVDLLLTGAIRSFDGCISDMPTRALGGLVGSTIEAHVDKDRFRDANAPRSIHAEVVFYDLEVRRSGRRDSLPSIREGVTANIPRKRSDRTPYEVADQALARAGSALFRTLVRYLDGSMREDDANRTFVPRSTD